MIADRESSVQEKSIASCADVIIHSIVPFHRYLQQNSPANVSVLVLKSWNIEFKKRGPQFPSLIEMMYDMIELVSSSIEVFNSFIQV